ncbi:C4-dicarboxylate ABC transporter substrate-binding protein [Pseudooceanicola sediminis]|uniref:C4-dicarboxylate ABC transporter substrate-binding protein n=1 Tax=Pseudooceanicola sediminis TaxID=2211117 RepID=A0A399J9D1_9RHOB|nr:C4-dicarboxylate ABC transporter substrate-binding protein [Pseudooceanicola sediminis]KAA2316342.1 C4-dicarboxylate ABC transporter substrate-binding protein [Puniceibacterium sp. HSS470]RII39256.1 C4-dicarboxylate ABC transporter substrate-binding protein [Pseudooceanicola sediminis]|tara:strand:+ start:13667 stop:14776 length:1110 start_codon:yes stop_codon:yes gene_type:complete
MRKTLSAALITVLGTGAALAETPIYGSWPPASDYLNTDTLPAAFAQIDADTDGAIQWELIAGGQLSDARGSLAAVGDNLMQGGLIIPVYTPEAMPSLTLLYSIVVPGDDPVAVAGAAAQTIFLDCPSCLDEAKDNQALPLGGFASASYRLMCTRPVATMQDLAGMRVRATGGYGEMAALGGATPMSVTLPEGVSLLQRGGLDCLMAAREWLQTYGYGEYAKYVTDLPLGVAAPAVGFLINRDMFLDMTPDQQAAHLRASALITAQHTIGNYVLRDQSSFEAQQADQGVKLVEPGADLIAMVDGFAETDRARLIENGKTLGVADPAALIDTYLANVEKWRSLSAEVGTDVDAFAAALWDEVFSKVDPGAL